MALSIAVGEIACSRPAPSPPSAQGGPQLVVVVQTPQPASSAQPAAEIPEAIDRLRPYAVTHARAARRTLYTWTTAEQIEELRRDRVLLTRTESPTQGPTYFDQVVEERARAGDKLAALLRTSAFRRSRFAWPAPWATLLGWEGESYGEELIRVTLKSDAWIAKLIYSKPGFEVVDLEDRPVPLAEVLRRPERLAAVYFVNDTARRARAFRGTYGGGTYAGTYAGAQVWAPYREYVLCNESMVEAWSVATAEIAAEIEASAAAVDAIRRHFTARPPQGGQDGDWAARVVSSVWPGPGLTEEPAWLYDAALSFPNEKYWPDVARLAALSRTLRALKPKGPAITHQPTPVTIR